MLKLEGFYIWVDNLDEAVAFYQKVFEQKITRREKDRWAHFGDLNTLLIGLYNYTVDNEEVKSGNNITPELKTDNIKKEHERITLLKPRRITDIIILEQPVLYKYFHFEDIWGNIWEVTEHSYD